ncbi:MAG: hypothetical protein WC275_03715 [Bacilli bacterium]
MKKSLVYQFSFLILVINCLFGCRQTDGSTVKVMSFLDYENNVFDKAMYFGISYFIDNFQKDDYTIIYHNETLTVFTDDFLAKESYSAIIGHPNGHLYKPREYFNVPLITSFNKLKTEKFIYPNHYDLTPSLKEEGKLIAETLKDIYQNILVFRSEDSYFNDIYESFQNNMKDISYRTIVLSDDIDHFVPLYPLFNVSGHDACVFLVSPHHYSSLLYAFAHHENKTLVVSPLYNRKHAKVPINYNKELFPLFYPAYEVLGLPNNLYLPQNITKSAWFLYLDTEEQYIIIDNMHQFREGFNMMVFLDNAISKDGKIVTNKWEINTNLKKVYENIYYEASLTPY